ncbi:MAG: hypothetical protein WC666_04385 [Candidatus Paceibacterota bacterium]|jgi:hypothetical protein
MKFPNILKSHKHIPEALKSRSAFSLIGRDPHVDWVIIILITVIVTIVSVVVGSMVYFNVGKSINEPDVSLIPDNKDLTDIKNLDLIIKEFDKRAEIRSDLIRGYAGPGDPSF